MLINIGTNRPNIRYTKAHCCKPFGR